MKDFVKITYINQTELINFKKSISNHINIKNFDITFEVDRFNMTRATVYVQNLENNTMNRIGQIISYFSDTPFPYDIVFYFYPDYIFFDFYSGDIETTLNIGTSFQDAFVCYFEKSSLSNTNRKMQLKDFDFNIANKPNVIPVENNYFSNLSFNYSTRFIFDFKKNGEFVENIKINFNNNFFNPFEKFIINGQLDFTLIKNEKYYLIDNSNNARFKSEFECPKVAIDSIDALFYTVYYGLIFEMCEIEFVPKQDFLKHQEHYITLLNIIKQ